MVKNTGERVFAVKILKKAAAVVLAAFMSIAPLGTTAAAHEFAYSADTLMSEEEYLVNLIDEGDTCVYKLDLNMEGVVTLKLVFHAEYSGLSLRDSDGAMVYPYRCKSVAGNASIQKSGRFHFLWDGDNKYYSGTVKYYLEPGKYYITLYKDTFGPGGEFSITPIFPKISDGRGFDDNDAVAVDDDEFTASGKTDKILSMSVEMTAGKTLNISKVLGLENEKEKNVRWYTSDRNVVSVSKSGKLKAKSAGFAVVTVYVGKEKSSIFVRVNEE